MGGSDATRTRDADASHDDRKPRPAAIPVTLPADADMTMGSNRTRARLTGMDARHLLWQLGRVFPLSQTIDAVTTTGAFDAPPDDVWQTLMFYEEVPGRPPLLLRTFLPGPVRTHGGIKQVGTIVECVYSRGTLVKQITALDFPRQLRFEVLEQNLGIERCMTTVEGSYEFRADDTGTLGALTTRYRGHLRPRWMWRPFERLLAHQLHRHILAGMGAKVRVPGGARSGSTS